MSTEMVSRIAELATAPIKVPRARVRSEWIDYNNHMNVAYYVMAFDEALEQVYGQIGLGEPYRAATDNSTMTLEMHVNYLREIKEGEPYDIDAQILGADAKRVCMFFVMRHGETGVRVATSESMMIHVSLSERRSTPFPDDVRDRLATIAEGHAALEWPPEAGRAVGFKKR